MKFNTCFKTAIFHPIFPKEGKDALFRAAKEGDIEAVRRQLTGHVSVNSQDKVVIECPVILTFLFHIIIKLCILTFLQDGRTAVFCAALYGHSDVVSLLISANADINLPEKVILIIIQSTRFCVV